MHSRDNLILILRSRLGRRRRASVITVGRKGIGRMNAGNGSPRREHQEIVLGMARLGMAMGVRAGQRFTALLSLLSPIQPLRRSCWTARRQRHCGFLIVEQIVKCFLIRRNSLSTLQWSIAPTMSVESAPICSRLLARALSEFMTKRENPQFFRTFCMSLSSGMDCYP